MLSVLLLPSCMHYGTKEPEHFSAGGQGVFISCEGNFMYGNASLSYYDPAAKHVENEVFLRANGFKLGDVAQSVMRHNSLVWVVVNNSGIIYAIDPDSFREVGRITGFTAPRYIHFASNDKAYVTQLWDPRICTVNPRTFEITGHIETDMDFATGSTEQMVQWGNLLFVSCWSYQNRIIVIDTDTDLICGHITVGFQPSALAVDRNGKVWCLTDGGTGHGEAPALYRIDAATQTVERVFRFANGDHPADMKLSATGDMLYFINGDVWQMEVSADALPLKPFIEAQGTIYYALGIDPAAGDIYVADAIDYVQGGVVARYSADGEKLDEFRVGIVPGSFCWK